MSELQRMLGLLPPAVPPAAAPPAWFPAPPTARIRQRWEPPGCVPEPAVADLDDDEAGYDDADNYDEDDYDEDDYEDDEDDYDEDDGFEGTDDLGRARHGSGAARRPARSPGAPPLGSYESRQAALRETRRRKPFRVVLLVVMVLSAIGVSADKLLARPETQLAIQSGPAATASASPSSAASANTAGTTALTSFAAYPGQQTRDGGQLDVNSVAVANGVARAVGVANGHPAIWRPGPGSSWSLTDSGTNGPLAGRPGVQALTAVTDGPAGWLAVGAVVSGAQEHPVVVTSADGRTWQAADDSPAFSGAGLYAYGATAGRADYVIVGEQVTGNTVTAASWWSAGLGTWSRVGTGGTDASGKPSAMFAVTVGPRGFIAAGAAGSQPAVWTSPNGQQWTVTDLPLPAGGTQAELRQVVIRGGRQVVATGDAKTPSGTVAFAAVSDDDGTTWHEVALPAPGAQATVTALAASSSGFVAAGLSGRSGASAVVWTSADGMNWASARAVPGPPGGQVRVITCLASTGREVKGIGVATTKTAVNAVLYTAPTP